MAILKIGTSLLIVKYLTNNNGKPYYQRRIPEELRHHFGGKRILKIKLDSSKGAPANQVQKYAKSHDALFRTLRNSPDLKISDKKIAAIALLDTYGLKQGDGNVRYGFAENEGWEFDDQPHLNHFFDELNDLDRNGLITETEKLAALALRNPLPTLLSETPQIYFDNHPKGNEERFKKRTLMEWNKFLNYFGDAPIERITREVAKQYKASREKIGLKSQSVQKEINVIRAIFNVVIREIPLTIKNPFENIAATDLGKDAEKHEPFSVEELQKILKECTLKDDDIRRLILILMCTGARLGEPLGLRKSDIFLNEEIPYIYLREYGNRTLKNKNSERKVPLIPISADAIKRQIEANPKSDTLFPRYCTLNERPNATTASARVNKWLKSIESTKTSHSFRHTMRDLLRTTNLPIDFIDEIGGWGTKTTGAKYGEGYSLKAKYDAIVKAFEAALIQK